jgi:hypothetical protein
MNIYWAKMEKIVKFELINNCRQNELRQFKKTLKLQQLFLTVKKPCHVNQLDDSVNNYRKFLINFESLFHHVTAPLTKV